MYKIIGLTNGADYLEIFSAHSDIEYLNEVNLEIRIKSYGFSVSQKFLCPKEVFRTFCKEINALLETGSGAAIFSLKNTEGIDLALKISNDEHFFPIEGTISSNCVAEENYNHKLVFGFEVPVKQFKSSLLKLTWA